MAKRRTKAKAKKIKIALFLIFIVAAAVTSYSVLKNYNTAYDPAVSATSHITVAPGMNTTDIAELLVEHQLIENAALFKIKSRLMGLDGKYQAGAFDLAPSMTTEEIMTALMSGKRESVRVTIPEGYNIKQTTAKLSQAGLIDEEDFIDALANGVYDYSFIDGLGAGEDRLEGFLFPDTYEFFADSSEEEIIDKMLAQFDAVFTQDYYARIRELGLTVKEAVTIASLIEEETRTAAERPIVSSVIYNRLNIDMKLQFCSTVLYALGEQKSRLLYSDLEVDSPYNTYLNQGLPPGPISSPGQASLDAALNPQDTDYLYFVLKGDGSGEHNFAENSSDFINYKEDYLNTLQ
jgi:UPF0755 protein